MTDEVRPARYDYDAEDADYRSGISRDSGFDGCILRPEYRDIHPLVADGLLHAASFPVLDLGCGRGALGRELDARGIDWMGVDRSSKQLAFAPGARIRADARQLPFADILFGSVAALYMLYHFEDPVAVIREAARVMLPGGTFVASAPSRFNHPELVALLPPQPRETFDAEVAPKLVAMVFEEVRVESWDVLAYRFEDQRSVWNYLVARQYPRAEAEQAAAQVKLPAWVRSRGAVVWARKPK